MKNAVAALLVAFGLSGCAGYRIGNVKPHYLEAVNKIAVPTFKNHTFQPQIEALVTNTVIKQLQQDGTFRIANEADADATLKGTIQAIGRTPVRSVRGNVLATTEFNLTITVTYVLVDKSGRTLTGPSGVAGTTSFFVGNDVTSDQRQAIPLATEDMAVRLTSQLTEGW
ncbi:MAG: LPS assembly lipoprotein LptE [Chthoniobacterales bacterium]